MLLSFVFSYVNYQQNAFKNASSDGSASHIDSSDYTDNLRQKITCETFGYTARQVVAVPVSPCVVWGTVWACGFVFLCYSV
jgi:hypothetical protein